MEKNVSFNSEGKLKIMQLTDVHWMDGSEKDQRTAALMRELLKAENPDFIVLTGDIVYGEKNLDQLETALAPVLESGKPWAYAFGNHDTEWGHTRVELCERAMTLPGCLMERGDPAIHGVGNYVIPVRDKDGKLCWTLYFFDSGAYNENEVVGGYDFIHRDQIDWYARTAERLAKEDGPSSALAFFHMPLPEYRDVWTYELCVGYKLEPVCCPRQNSGLFSAMLEAGNMRGVFVGHDHLNDYDGAIRGIRLIFGRASGYNTYGREDYPHGARIIELDTQCPDTFRSWIRMDTGEAVYKQLVHMPSCEHLCD